MPETKWIPDDFVDEISPEPRDRPEDWVIKQDHGFVLDNEEGASGPYEDPQPVLADDQIVEFVSITHYGITTLTFHDDEIWTVADPMPEGAEQCCVLLGWQSETLGLSVEESAELLRESEHGSGNLPGEYPLAYYTYSDPIKFVFREQTASFERMGTA